MSEDSKTLSATEAVQRVLTFLNTLPTPGDVHFLMAVLSMSQEALLADHQASPSSGR
jgi:hypothetical protein